MFRAPMMDTQQHAELLALNPKPQADPSALCLHHLFEQQDSTQPDAPCIKLSPDSDTWLTYGQVEAKANRVAHLLMSLGVGADTIVAVCASRGPNLYIAMLAILKAGGAYLPMDANYPAERLAYMVEVSGVKCLLTDTALQSNKSIPQTEHVSYFRLHRFWRCFEAIQTRPVLRDLICMDLHLTALCLSPPQR